MSFTMASNTNKQIVMSITIPSKIKKRIVQISDRTGASISSLVKIAIDEKYGEKEYEK